MGDQLGYAVAVDTSKVLAGAPRRDVPAQDSGAVYAFELLGGWW